MNQKLINRADIAKPNINTHSKHPESVRILLVNTEMRKNKLSTGGYGNLVLNSPRQNS